MSAPAVNTPQPTNPGEAVFQAAFAYMSSACLHAVIELGVPDLLGATPRPVGELAREANANEDALYRTMRLLVSMGIFTETAPRTFAHSPASATLRSDAPNSTRAIARFVADPMHLRTYAELLYSVRTGRPCADVALGKPIFDYLATDPQESEVFNAAMVAMSAQVVPAVLEAYDFSGIRLLVDVAGGHGSVICPILQKYPPMRGILTDLAHVLETATACICDHGVQERLERIPCDFFKAVPAGGDAYIMKNIIHDWDDEKCLVILGNIRRAMGDVKGKVILLETILVAGPEPHMSKFLDIEMLALPGGRERTEAEFAALFERAGFRLTRVAPTKSPFSVIEAVRV
ncbi:MAG TPA: methyltransferase [Candidatus Acidoferrales bacterium]